MFGPLELLEPPELHDHLELFGWPLEAPKAKRQQRQQRLGDREEDENPRVPESNTGLG